MWSASPASEPPSDRYINILTPVNTTLSAEYKVKPADYYRCVREEMVPYIPVCRRLLDVGCGQGDFGAFIKEQRFGSATIEVWGVEPMEGAYNIAVSRLDVVKRGEFGEQLELPEDYFDCIVFNDVLEHMIDPVGALAYAKTLLGPEGVIVASIPNIRHFKALWEIVVRGDWTYREYGILDKTHLRFFTRKSIPGWFAAAGLKVQKLEGINPYLTLHSGGPRWRYFIALNALTFGGISDMKFLQFAVVARA